MSLFYMDSDERDLLRDELRAKDRAERARYRVHWCRDCLGNTGKNSPCYDGPDEEPEEEESSDD